LLETLKYHLNHSKPCLFLLTLSFSAFSVVERLIRRKRWGRRNEKNIESL